MYVDIAHVCGHSPCMWVDITVPNQNYPQGVFNPVYACFTVVEDTRCILRMHNERIYSVTLVIHNSCITHDAHRV